MTSAPQTNTPNTPAASNGSATIVRIILFVILGYMIFALAYDYLYVFKTHEAKFQEVRALVEKETARSADDRKKSGPIGPKEVQEVMGFAPAIPLKEIDEHNNKHEKYVFRRGLPWMTRDIDVYYTGYKSDAGPAIYGVAHSEEEKENAIPQGPTKPNTDAVSEPTDEEKKGDEKASEPVEEKKTDDAKPEETKPEETKPEGAKPEETKAEDKKADEPAAEPTPDDKKSEETKE